MERGITTYKDGKLIRHDEIASIHGCTIGTQFERGVNSGNIRWNLLKKLNNKDRDTQREIKASHEIFRIKSQLNVPIKSKFIFSRYKKFYPQLTPDTLSRGYQVLVPVSIFITLKENSIFFNHPKFYKLMECRRRSFNLCLKEVYKNNLELYKLFRSDLYRRSYIHQTLIAMTIHFKFPNNFLTLSKGFLEEYYNDFKIKSDHVIIGLISAMVRKVLNNNLNTSTNQVSMFLGISGSVITNNKALWDK